jgi:hypothetical protein
MVFPFFLPNISLRIDTEASLRITPQTAADLLLIVLCKNGEAMHKISDGKAVQGAQRLMLVCLVIQ